MRRSINSKKQRDILIAHTEVVFRRCKIFCASELSYGYPKLARERMGEPAQSKGRRAGFGANSIHDSKVKCALQGKVGREEGVDDEPWHR